jgi:hypothetical protein
MLIINILLRLRLSAYAYAYAPVKTSRKGRQEAASISEILYLFGQGNFIFIRKKS